MDSKLPDIPLQRQTSKAQKDFFSEAVMKETSMTQEHIEVEVFFLLT